MGVAARLRERTRSVVAARDSGRLDARLAAAALGPAVVAAALAAATAGATGIGWALLLGLGGAVPVGLVAVARLRRDAADPLRDLAGTMRRLAEGEADEPIPAPPRGAPCEVADLATACALFRDAAAERTRLGERLRWFANFDPLTGLPNRALLRDRLDLAVAMAGRPEDAEGLGVLALDLDRFKEVNDALGHGAGDAVLRGVAARLSECLRPADTLARLGGDEFVLVAPGLSGTADLAGLADRLIASLADPFEVEGRQFRVGLSVGAVLRRGGGGAPGDAGDEDGPEALLRDADLALYEAKREGGGALRVFAAALDERLRARRALASDVGEAVARGDFRLAFQPQVSVATGRVLGGEALLRWGHPSRGAVPPDLFVPVAEETGQIVPLGAWVMEEACRVASGWPGSAFVAVNVSALQVRAPGFVATVERALSLSGFPARRLELEITEAVMLAHSTETLATLARLRALGVRLAMDDFGTGYSSLATLHRFRFDKIKVDRGFVREIATDPRALALLRAAVGMGSALGVATNAEGVEDEAQLELLRAEGVDEAQGYLFGRPMPARDFLALIERDAADAAGARSAPAMSGASGLVAVPRPLTPLPLARAAA